MTTTTTTATATATAKRIRPDLEFVRRLVAVGGDKLKSCMQCANCSVACGLSHDGAAFPRREMHLAQWGQREELIADPHVWLCHGCTDCSEQCPRGARPGDVLAAVRMEAVRHYTPLPFMGRAVADPKWLPVLLAVPALLFAAILLVAGVTDTTPDSVLFADLFAPGVLEPLLFVGTAFGLLVFATGVTRFYRDLERHAGPAEKTTGLLAAGLDVAKDVVLHRKFRECENDGRRTLAHILTFGGFALLFVGGTIVGVLMMLGWLETPLALLNPLKIAMNIGALSLLVGSFLLIRVRLSRQDRDQRSSFADWQLLGFLFLGGLTGILTEVLRLLNLQATAYGMYFVHLVIVLSLLLYAPWSKLAHFAYRAAALVHLRTREAPEPSPVPVTPPGRSAP